MIEKNFQFAGSEQAMLERKSQRSQRMNVDKKLFRDVAPFAAVVALLVVGYLMINGFMKRDNLESIAIFASFLGISAGGQTLVIILGGIDLSVAALVGLGEVLTTVLYGHGVPIGEIVLLIVGCGIAIGAVNGGISSFLRIHPLIVTLGVGFMVEGIVLVRTGGGSEQGVSPSLLVHMVGLHSQLGPIPIPPVVFVWAAVAIILILLQRWTTVGRHIYALGSNPEAAQLALVPRNRTWILAYIVSALCALVTGFLLSGFSGGSDFSVGNPYLFNSIAAVVIGGTSLLGGSGGYGRTVVGSIIVMELTTILVGVGLGPNMQEALLGVFIILVVAISGRESGLRTRV